MSLSSLHSVLIAVDVGNTRIKWGLFVSDRLVSVVSLPHSDHQAYDRQLEQWQLQGSRVSWAIASVNSVGLGSLLDWMRVREFSAPCELNDPALLPLRVDLGRPEAVGIDRLLDAVAANARRPQGRAAVIVDAGSAITVDAVSAEGHFMGGTIAIGLGMAARALHEFTDLLPQLSVSWAPNPLGKSTADAMRSGLFWGAVGAVKELIRRVGDSIGSDPVIYVAGGDADLLAPHLGIPVELVPDLTLHGISLAYQYARSIKSC